MGTIAEKLTYLSGTKDKLKDSINNIGGSITNETTFRAYATELDNIYSSLPKTTGEGSNLSLSPTLKGKLDIEAYKGYTTQDSTTGINLFNISAFTTATTIQGVTFTPIENGGIKMSGTSTNTGQLDIAFSYTANGNYTMATIVDGTFTASPQVLCQDSNGNVMYNNAMSSNTTKINTFNNVSATIIRARIYFTSGITFNCTLYTMLLSGTYTSSNLPSFEPYTNGASPNPTYPQYTEVVTGEQEVVVQNKNLWGGYTEFNVTNASVNYSTKTNGIITANGTTSGAYSTSCTIDNAVANNVYVTLQAGTYSVKCEQATTNLRVQIHDIETRTQLLQLTSSSASTFTLTGTTKVLAHISVANSGTSLNTTFYVQIEKGSTSTDFVEHQEQTKTLHLGDIELSKIGTYQDRIYKNNDKWYIEKNVDKFRFDGTETIRTTDYSNAYTITKNTITNKGFDVPTNTTNALSNCFGIVANQSELASIGALRFGGTYAIFNYDNSVANPTAFKTLLDTTTYFYFPLATPTYTEITNTNLLNELNELEKMMSYSGTTNISVNGSLPMILNVSALKGE